MTVTLNACLTGIPVPDFDGDLTVTLGDDSTFPLRTPGWCVTELFPVWQEGDVSGSLVDLAGIDGQLAEALHRIGSRFDLEIVVTGAMGPTLGEDDVPDFDSPFVKYDDPWKGLEANLALLQVNVLSPTLIGNGTRPWVLTMPSGDTRNADVHAQPRLDLQDKWRWVHRYLLTIGIAKGRFA